MDNVNDGVSVEKLFKLILDNNVYDAITFFESESDENKRKLYTILIDHITNMIAPKSTEISGKENDGNIEANISNIVKAFDLLDKDDKIEFLEYTMKSTFEAIDRYYDKYEEFCFNRDNRKESFFTLISMHNLSYEKDSVFRSRLFLELANNYFKYLKGNEVTIDGLIGFSIIMQIDDCLEQLGEIYASGLHKDEKLENDFLIKLATALENGIQDGNLSPNNVNPYLRLLKASFKDKDSIWTRNKGLLMERTDNILEALEIIGDEYRNDPEIIEKVESRIGDLAEQIMNECNLALINDNIREWVEVLLKEIGKNEKTNLTQLRRIGAGAYSKAFSLGEKVIKIGINNEQFELPRNSRRFIQPIVRMELGDWHFEVSEKVTPAKEEDVTEEELYEIYKELRDDDLYLEDFKAENFGRLIKPNEIYVDAIKETGGNPKRSFGPNIGIKKDEDVDVLGPGELVIIDLDYIYPYSYWKKHESDFPRTGRMKKFSDRYEREKRANKGGEKGED